MQPSGEPRQRAQDEKPRDSSPPRHGTAEDLDRYVNGDAPPPERSMWDDLYKDMSGALDYAWESFSAMTTLNLVTEPKDEEDAEDAISIQSHASMSNDTGSLSECSSDRLGDSSDSDDDDVHLHSGALSTKFPGLPTLDPSMYMRQAREPGTAAAPATSHASAASANGGAAKLEAQGPVFDAWSYHRRRLQQFGLQEVEMEADGNCQFRAVADQMFGDQERHGEVRAAACKHLKKHARRYRGHVDSKYEDYIKVMQKNGTWGDHVTLQAVADKYTVRLQIATPVMEEGMLEIAPGAVKEPGKPRPVLWLSFWPEVHYNSLHPLQMPPAVRNRSPYLELPLPHKSDEVLSGCGNLVAGYRLERQVVSGDDDSDGGADEPPAPTRGSSVRSKLLSRFKSRGSKAEVGEAGAGRGDATGELKGGGRAEEPAERGSKKPHTWVRKVGSKIKKAVTGNGDDEIDDDELAERDRAYAAHKAAMKNRDALKGESVLDEWLVEKEEQAVQERARRRKERQQARQEAADTANDDDGWETFMRKMRSESERPPLEKFYGMLTGSRR